MSHLDRNGENCESKKEKVSINETEGIIFPVAPQSSFENSEQIGISSYPVFQCVDDLSIFQSVFFFPYSNFLFQWKRM